MKRAEFITLSASTMMLTALGIDIMLPVLGEIRHYYNLPKESTDASLIITFFFMGQIAQFPFGVLSDRLGRLRILRVGFPLYILGGIVATFAPSLIMMCIARFIAGMGASAVFMTTIASVRDRFAGDQMAKIMSLIFTIFLFTPIIAPFLGLAILSISSWKTVFLTPPLFAVLIFIWSFRLEESLTPEQRRSQQKLSMVTAFRKVIGNAVFVRYMFTTTALFSILSSYVASSEYVISEIFGRPQLFAWVFAGIGLLMSCCSLINSRLSIKFGARRAIRGLLSAYLAVAFLLFLLTMLSGNPPDFWLFFAGVALLLAINIAIEPNSSALALEPMGELAGTASAVYGTCFFFIGSSIGAVVSYFLQKSVIPMAIGFFLMALIALLLVRGDKRPIEQLS